MEICSPSSRTRAWILLAGISTFRLGSIMKQSLSAKFEARAHGTQVDMRAGGLARHRLAEREVGNAVGSEVLAEPNAFGRIGMEGDIHTAAVIEAQRAVHLGFAHGAHRQRFSKTRFEGGLHTRKNSGREYAIAIEAVAGRRRRCPESADSES